jgi:hypothetical protein
MIGNFDCDDGTDSTLDFNCPEFNCDGNDCSSGCYDNGNTSGGDTGGNDDCVDILINGSDWYDSDGETYDCDWYATGNNCEYGDSFANFGYTANDACCVCGGGTIEGNDGGSSGGDDSSDECVNSFTVYGSDPNGQYGACSSDGSGYYYFEWLGGCLATSMDYGSDNIDLTSYEP